MTSPLIPAPVLVRDLARGRVPVILDVRYWLNKPGQGRDAYAQGHVPGAIFVDLDAELAAPVATDGRGGRHPLPSPEAFSEQVAAWGIDADTDVVVYDQQASLAAGRLWWMLTDHGVRSVQVLDGGYAAWLAAGGRIDLEAHEGDALKEGFASHRRLRRVEADEIGSLLASGHRLIDVRAAERYRGDVEPIDRIAGHIPGAENLPATTLQTADGRFRSPAALRELLGPLSSSDALSCGSGVTAAQVALAVAAAGLPVPRLYVGSYSDWVSDPNRPVVISE